jgi:NAD(P)-dependent dehydrogenase (short-subunit alcohol dehydrogenase family)
MSLEGRVALVTGASRGIGRSIALRLAAEGARVVACARSEDAIAELAAEIDGVAVPMDVADPASIDAALERVGYEVGPVDVLVPNAGIAESAPYDRTTGAMWDRMMAVNCTSVVHLVQKLVPSMVARGSGRVVIVASNAGLMGYAYTSAYCASKHAVLGFMRAVALEIAKTPVTINAVCPGWVDTAMAAEAVARIAKATGRSEDQAKGALERMSPQGRLVAPEEVADLVAMLAGDAAASIHGQAIAIDGGQTMR